jgi:hypothetical protein
MEDMSQWDVLLRVLVAGLVTVTILLLGMAEKRLEGSLEGFYEEPEEGVGRGVDDRRDGPAPGEG